MDKELLTKRTENILNGMANNIDYAALVIGGISINAIPIVFANKDHKFIFNEMRDAYMEFQTFNKQQIITATYQKNLGKEVEELKAYRKYITEVIYKENDIANHLEWYIKEAQSLIKETTAKHYLWLSYDKFNAITDKGNNNYWAEFNSIIEQYSKEGIEENELWNAEEHMPEVHDYLTAEHQTITTGIDGLDYSMWGGWRKKTLNVVCAGTSVGKSFFMTNNACAAIRNNNNVMYITMEMTKEDVIERIAQNILGMTRNEIKKENKHNFDNEMRKQLAGSVLYVEEMKKGASAFDIKNKVKKVIDIKKKHLDVVFIDYMGYMGENNKKGDGKKNDNTYIKYKNIAEELHEVAKTLNMPVITAMQLGRYAGKDGKEPDLENISDSHGVSTTADNVIVMYYNSAEIQQNVGKEGQGEIKLKHSKRRQGGRGGIYYTCLINLYNQKLSEKLDAQQSNQTESHAFGNSNSSGFPDDSNNDWDFERSLVNVSSDNVGDVPF